MLLLTLAVAGCPLSKAEPNNGVSTNELLRAIDGRAKSLNLGGVELEELPAEFDLNPNLKRDEEARAKTGIPFQTKEVAVLVSRRRVGVDEVSVKVTPFIDRKRQSGLLLTQEVRDSQEWRVAKSHKQTTLTSKRRNEPTTIVLGADGHEKPDVASGWCLFIALAGKDGIICWSETPKDAVINPRKSGFRRFRLEGATDTEGWRLLKPLPPK